MQSPRRKSAAFAHTVRGIHRNIKLNVVLIGLIHKLMMLKRGLVTTKLCYIYTFQINDQIQSSYTNLSVFCNIRKKGICLKILFAVQRRNKTVTDKDNHIGLQRYRMQNLAFSNEISPYLKFDLYMKHLILLADAVNVAHLLSNH